MLLREGSRCTLALPRLGLLAVAAVAILGARSLFAAPLQPADYYDEPADGAASDGTLLTQAPVVKPPQPGTQAPKATQPNAPSTKPPQPSPPRPAPLPVNPPQPPGPLSQPTPSQANRPPENTLAANDFGTGNELAYSLASTPDMIGDLRNAGRFVIEVTEFNSGKVGTIPITIPLGGGDRSPKISDDSSPIPTDRFFFDDNYFNNAAQAANGPFVALNRATFGVEKTFCGGLWSVELRAPVESGLASDQTFTAATGANEGTVFGDLSITPKILLYKDDTWAFSTGLMIALPTAPDCSIAVDSTVIGFQNRAVYLEPFVGAAYAPNQHFFAISYVQLSFDEGGDPVTQSFGQGTESVGKLCDPSLLNVDLSVGYWLFHDQSDCCCCCGRYVTGLAPIVELHYTTTLEHFQAVGSFNDDPLLTPLYDGEDVLNLTAGLHFALGPCSSLTVAGVVPVRTALRDKEFDSEAIVEFDRRF